MSEKEKHIVKSSAPLQILKYAWLFLSAEISFAH